MKNTLPLKLLTVLFLLSGCSKESPELLPCMCDGSESTLGVFDCMCEPMKKKPVRRISYIQDEKPQMQTIYIDDNTRNAYLYLHQRRDTFAPIKLEYVDFRIKKGRQYEDYSTKLGNYRFRIFGCRRESKNVFLNQGRAMQKDMRFFDVFFEQMNDYYPVVVDKTNPYYPESDKIETPEYLLTAEITDYFMNICDEFDWNNVKQKKLRSGSSEITVTWRVMNLLKDEVYCKGTTTGYGQISEGEPNGETLLVERAFEDALNKVPEIECFNNTLSQRIRPQELQSQLEVIRNQEHQAKTFNSQYEKEMKGIELLQSCASDTGAKSSSVSVTPFNGGEDAYFNDGIDENHGALGSSTNIRGFYDETGKFIEDSSGNVFGFYDENGNFIEETAGSRTDGSVFRSYKDRTGSVRGMAIDERCREIAIDDGCTVVKNTGTNVTIADDYWIDVPLNSDEIDVVNSRRHAEDSFSDARNRFCIKNHIPYANLNPHNLYKVRASVVSVENPVGRKGAGLIISDNLILTSADLLVKDNNNFNIQTINGNHMKAAAFRVNPKKNVALLLLSQNTQYTPLPLSLDLPEVNKDVLMTLGLLDLDNEGEGYIDNEGRGIGYRWSEERGAEIIVDTFVQTVSLGGALIDKNGNIVGLAHEDRKSETSPDLFIPIETALKGLGLEICGREFSSRVPVITETAGSRSSNRVEKVKPSPIKSLKMETTFADAVDNSTPDNNPKVMKGLERK